MHVFVYQYCGGLDTDNILYEVAVDWFVRGDCGCYQSRHLEMRGRVNGRTREKWSIKREEILRGRDNVSCTDFLTHVLDVRELSS